MRGHQPFDNDVETIGRYVYTGSQARKSSIIANQLQTKMLHEEISKYTYAEILDLGCGDGTYTFEFLNLKGVKILGMDPAQKAIEVAKKRYAGESRLSFTSAPIEELILAEKHFDLTVLRGVLHHCEDPSGVLLMASKVSDRIVILEPNGWNPIMKLIEKVSPYHRRHSEKSFTKGTITKWLNRCGFAVESYSLGILVPFFFPSPLIPLMLKLEPAIHKVPVIGKFLFGTQVFLARRI
jgi:ubiquinone/menaquinone biosynthesis C-methylase UbiE